MLSTIYGYRVVSNVCYVMPKANVKDDGDKRKTHL